MTKVAVCLADPVVDDARGNAGTATLGLRLDERPKLSERRRHRRRLRPVVDGVLAVRSAGLDQALDQRGRTAPRSVIEVQGIDRVASRLGQHQAERLAG